MKDKIYSRDRIYIPIFDKLKRNNYDGENNFQKRKNAFALILIVIIAVTTASITIRAITPIIDNLCVDEAKNIATKISNQEASKVMNKYTYEDLITIIRDDSGNIKMLQINTKTVNELISDIPVNILAEYKKSENSNIYIRMGSILGIRIFSSLGPQIKIKISNVGNVETNLKSEFKSEGINQTLHRIYLDVSCQVTMLTPYNTIKEKIINQVLIAESVIVGEVPESYYNLNTSNINDDAIRVIDSN